METCQEMADELRPLIPRLRAGTPRLYGVWFGIGPMENKHDVVDIGTEGNCLVIRFDRGEVLRVWEPKGLSLGGRAGNVPDWPWPVKTLFRISAVSRVRIEWYVYGRPPLPENLLFDDYVPTASGMQRQTNSHVLKQVTAPVAGYPAVEFLARELPSDRGFAERTPTRFN